MGILTGAMLLDMVRCGADSLRQHCDEVNDLNVFPIPDGDTGSNMLLTIEGGAEADGDGGIGTVAEDIAHRMLLSARGNSGVILSQLFAGLAEGLKGLETAGMDQLRFAGSKAVESAYGSVITPTEGTILTVARESHESAADRTFEDIPDMLESCVREAKISLEHTPEKLEILKLSGVVDSGGAGLVYILEGMLGSLTGRKPEGLHTVPKAPPKVNVDLFTENSELEFGYCTELLLRLQKSKCDPEAFDTDAFIKTLETLGNSIVAFKNGSIVKLHIHTMQPYQVLELCQRYGEYLTVKIENMMLQHNEVVEHESIKAKDRQKYAVVAVANGDGIKEALLGFGADVIIDGGQTMNPSASEMIAAFDKANADTIFVLPNNGNIILAANQAAELYNKSDVRVIPSKNIGDCYSVLSMLDLDSDDPDRIEAEMNEAMEGTVTAEISCSIRSTKLNGIEITEGEYIGIIGKTVVSADTDCLDTATAAIDIMRPNEHSSMIILEGKDAFKGLSSEIAAYVRSTYPNVEVFESHGGQEIYDFILVVN
ncbi:MAG: DAK2 domain-containing protein [Ruminococcus sp.]|nr:DAK2 domain-containing protein [Ruminococcus sp.]